LYERTTKRPAVNVTVNENDPATWPGFDAVEAKQEKLFVYHYLGPRWQAPIVFQPDIDAVPFLRHLALSWKLVEQTVPAATWKRIQGAIDGGQVTHVIAFDPEQSLVAKDTIENASREYAIDLQAADYRTI